MSADDQDIFSTMIRVENKDLFVDLKKNNAGKYLKISERKGTMRNTILVPVSGIQKLQAALEEIVAIAGAKKTAKSTQKNTASTGVASSVPVSSNKVFVRELSYATTEDILSNHFSSAGNVVSATILQTTRRGKTISKGIGLVEFTSVEEAEAAIKALNNTELDGRKISCRADREPTPRESTTTTSPIVVNIVSKSVEPKKVNKKDSIDHSNRVPVPGTVYVTSLSGDTTDETLSLFFSVIGTVEKAEVKRQKSGRSIRQGTVVFADVNDAVTAIERLNKETLDGKVINVREFYE